MSAPLARHVRMEVYAQMVLDLLPVTVMGLALVEQLAQVMKILYPIFLTSSFVSVCLFCISATTIKCVRIDKETNVKKHALKKRNIFSLYRRHK